MRTPIVIAIATASSAAFCGSSFLRATATAVGAETATATRVVRRLERLATV